MKKINKDVAEMLLESKKKKQLENPQENLKNNDSARPHLPKDCGVFVAEYAEYLSEGMDVSSVDFEAEYHRMRYAALLQNYGLQKAKKGYVSDNDDPPRLMTKKSPYPMKLE
ncbi:hypothetical protein T459_34353 [Capsicum annuum]|uniref:Ubiquitin-like protease family profile domain-containing protein n=1 Tax=Capsicum annuum TaxID=4072 RepID=A0A2G2XWH4_CAPAN|nr:hypothetical protein T459_34353 [Capsicum annuum]